MLIKYGADLMVQGDRDGQEGRSLGISSQADLDFRIAKEWVCQGAVQAEPRCDQDTLQGRNSSCHWTSCSAGRCRQRSRALPCPPHCYLLGLLVHPATAIGGEPPGKPEPLSGRAGLSSTAGQSELQVRPLFLRTGAIMRPDSSGTGPGSLMGTRITKRPVNCPRGPGLFMRFQGQKLGHTWVQLQPIH